jgi:hypothetical protein
MRLKVYLEPFIELFLTRADFDFKVMRFLGRIPFFRNKGFDLSYRQNKPEVLFSELVTTIEPDKIVETIDKDGFCAGLRTSEDFFNYLTDVLEKGKFIDRKTGSGKYSFKLSNLQNPDTGYIYSLLNPHDSNERLMNFALKEIKPIADAYLGANSVILNSQIWVTFPDDSSQYNPDFGFHYDLDDYRFVKLFFYLTDVDSDSGPHQIIRGSHKINGFYRFFNRRLSDAYPASFEKNIEVMLAKKGEGFFEDTLCYHKGTRPIKPRAIFQLQFALPK